MFSVHDYGNCKKPGDVAKFVGSFETELAAAEFISTLPEFETGRYDICDCDCREDQIMTVEMMCPECGRIFDLADPDDANEWYNGHDCSDDNDSGE